MLEEEDEAHCNKLVRWSDPIIENTQQYPVQILYKRKNFVTSINEVKALFQKFGNVLDVIIPQSNNKSRGCAIITMENEADADKAVKELNIQNNIQYQQDIWIIARHPNLINSQDNTLSQILNVLQDDSDLDNFQRIQTLQTIHQTLCTYTQCQIFIIFDNEAIKLLTSFLTPSNSEIQSILLDILLLIIQSSEGLRCVTDNEFVTNYDYRCFGQQDDILANIQKCLNQFEFTSQQYSTNQQKLIIIFIDLVQHLIIDPNFLLMYSQIIRENINSTIRLIHNRAYFNDEQLNQIKQSSLLINSLNSFSNNITRNNFHNINYMIFDQDIHTELFKIFHICCPYSLNCSYSTEVELNPSIVQLQFDAAQTLLSILKLNKNNQSFIEELIHDNEIFHHLNLIFLKFIQNNNNTTNISENKLSIHKSFSPLIIIYLRIMQLFLIELPNDFDRNELSPEILKTLFKLTNINKSKMIQSIDQAQRIRDQAFVCINPFCFFGLKYIRCFFSDDNFIQRLCQIISVAGGTSEDHYSPKDIRNAFASLAQFIFSINNINQNNYKLYHKLTTIIKDTDEIFEEQGSNEELDSAIKNSNERGFGSQVYAHMCLFFNYYTFHDLSTLIFFLNN